MNKCTKCKREHKRIRSQLCPSCYNADWARKNPEKSKINLRNKYERHRILHGIKPHKPLMERFFDKTQRYEGGCLIWTGCKDPKGYGSINIERRHVKVHRFAYETVFGAIPKGLEIDHLCRNPSCVEPTHLEAVTSRENTLRGDRFSMGRLNRDKTHCLRGHPYDEDNTYKHRNHRYCKACHNISRRKGFTGWPID